jgi:phenylacetate-coenzyme A ligase PaaK-like adenylate-forming protein
VNSDGTDRYEATRLRHVAYMSERMPGWRARLSWSRAEIEAEQTRALRDIVRYAVERSPWHRLRLRHIDVERLTPAGLGDVPPMTKSDLMQHWDAIVTDPCCTLDAAEAHLAQLTGDAYFCGSRHVVASGGSSGQRGVFLYDWHGWAACWLGLMRGTLTVLAGIPGGAEGTWAFVTAYRATHATGSCPQTFSNPAQRIVQAPVTLPVAEIVARLNQARPSVLVCYASMLPVLADEAHVGRLKIEPKVICNTSEPLFPEARLLAESSWGALVLNAWATSESIAAAFSCAVGPGFHIGEDMNVIEPVDARGNSARRGARSAKILLTNLYNRALPLIRYEITDEFEVADAPCPCGSAYLKVADVYGRAEDAFAYPGGVKAHPHVFRSLLGNERAIIAYQVRQTEQGVMIDVVNPSAANLDGLRAAIEEQLRILGLAAPSVGLQNVDAITRQTTGKLKRFVPLAP